MRTYFLSIFCLLIFSHCCKVAAQQDGGIKPGADTAAINSFTPPGYRNIKDPDSIIAVFDARFKLCVEANYIDGGFTELIQISIKYLEKEDFAADRNACIKALPWAAKSTIKDATAWCYNNIGDSYFSEGNYVPASSYYYKSLEELKKMKGPPTHVTANCYNNLGLVNIRLGQPEKALAYFKQAEDISRKYQMGFQLGNALINRGDYYNSVHQPDSAIKCFTEVMELGEKIGKPDLRAEANTGLGKVLIVSGSYHKAIPLLQAAITGGKNYPYIVVDASSSLGDALCRTGKYKEAESTLLSALRETKAHNYRDNYLNCYSKLINVYKTSGNYRTALEYTDSMNAAKDTLASYANVATINQMEIKYETAEKDKQIAQSQLLIAQQRNKIINKNIWIASVVGGIFLLVVIMTSVYRNGQNKQRLQAAKIESLQQENTIGILKGVMQGEEKERGRIARELHDGIGGILSAAMMRFASATQENETIMQTASFRDGMSLLDGMGDEIRKTAHNLMPEVLLKQPLPDAIRTYCNFVQQGNAVQINFQTFGSFDNIAQSSKLNIYRIVQELLKNIIKHSQASSALVQLLMNEHLLTVTVEDNGIGFNTGELKKGMGLHNLQTRVSSMQGQLTIESGAEKGTSVYIEFDTQKMTANES